MTSLLRWMAQKLTNSANDVTQHLALKCIQRFLEESSNDDNQQLLIFDDWSLQGYVKQAHVRATEINSYLTNIRFSSLYFASLKINSSHTLTQFNIEASRAIGELNYNVGDETIKPCSETEAALRALRESLPIPNNETLMEYFSSKLTNLHVAIGSVELHNYEESIDEHVTKEIENFILTYKKSNAIPWVINMGEMIVKTKKCDFLELKPVQIEISPVEILITIQDMNLILGEKVADVLVSLIGHVKDMVQAFQTMPEKPIHIKINRLKYRFPCSLTGEIRGIDSVFNDSLYSITIGQLFSFFNDKIIFAFDTEGSGILVRRPFILKSNYIVVNEPEEKPEFPKTLDNIQDWQENMMNFSFPHYKIEIPSLTLSIEKDDIKAIRLFLSKFSQFLKIFHLNDEKLITAVQISNAAVSINDIKFNIKDINSGIFTNCLSDLMTHITLRATSFESSENLLAISSSYPFQILSTIICDYHQKPKYFINSIISSLVYQCTSFDYMNLICLKDLFSSYSLDISFRNCFIDYCSLEYPIRFICPVNSLTANVSNFNDDPKLYLSGCINGFLNNTRGPLSLKIYSRVPFDLKPFYFADTFKLNFDSFCFCSDGIYGNKLEFKSEFCADSMSLFTLFVSKMFPKYNNEIKRTYSISDLEQQLSVSFTGALVQSTSDDVAEIKESLSSSTLISDSLENLEKLLPHEPDDPDFDCDYDEEFFENTSESKTYYNINVMQIVAKIKLYPGRDFAPIYNLKTFDSFPKYTNEEIESDFDYITLRNDSQHLELHADFNFNTKCFDNDPIAKFITKCQFTEFSIKDHLINSAVNYLCRTDTSDGIVSLTYLGKKTFSVSISLPEITLLVNQQHINFLNDFCQNDFQLMSENKFVVKFNGISIKGNKLNLATNFRFWVDVICTYSTIELATCNLFTCSGIDELIGSIVEFYWGECFRRGNADYASDQTILANLRRISSAIRNLFVYGISQYGLVRGFTRSMDALLQILAVEVVNKNKKTTVASRFYTCALDTLNAKGSHKTASENAIATITMKNENQKPQISLISGVLGYRKLSELRSNNLSQLPPVYVKK